MIDLTRYCSLTQDMKADNHEQQKNHNSLANVFQSLYQESFFPSEVFHLIMQYAKEDWEQWKEVSFIPWS